ncbi:histidine ammonia-lyase (plasmid) [Streptomyces sp. NBC_00841]|uniref:HAL/PAL/TAL family ammonia-lyase n=1 Tax=unclassified Streptomyces TaxID=2593676 RepID=UPI00224E380D|nr:MULTISPECIES: histidine ammonia-lyase [unclassified Streptomyces]MCX4538941.1 histidine ammonia-lyase [Streptomyces sp. NBC_01669]WSA04826.1 histidine ammonia-lyase [Streptomyces sp. NBC_00841]
MNALQIGAIPLTMRDLIDVARRGKRVELAPGSADRMRASLDWVSDAVAGRLRDDPGAPVEPIYSINTGFGSLAGRKAFERPEQASDLSRRLIISNACGVGRLLEPDLIRAAMLIRAVSLARGHSGVRVEVAQAILDMLNHDVLPAVPEYGSLGASGDLIPLAHLAIVLSRAPEGEDLDEESGQALLNGQVVSGLAAMKAAGLERLKLGPKEGLALTNGTSFSTAMAALAVHDARQLALTSEVTAAMTIEALTGFGDAFLPQIHEARGHPGQIASAAHLRALLKGSAFIDGSEEEDPRRQPPQDAYSLRCVPQVLGAVRESLEFVGSVVEREINAATDNPLIFPELPASRRLKAVSGGNFHAEYLAFASDFTAIAVTEIGSIAERRLFRLDDGTLNRGLPDMLVRSEDIGMDCGYMLPQYLAAALVSDCKTLAHPDSVDSIPTCANQEDHVSMANNAGRHARQVVANIENVIGIELVMAAQALELRLEVSGKGPEALSPASRAVIELVRSTPTSDGRGITHLTRDVVMYPRVRAATELVHAGAVLDAVAPITGGEGY